MYVNEILLIPTEKLQIINHIGEIIIQAIKVEKTNNVFILLPALSILLIINLSIWFVAPHKNEANIVRIIGKTIIFMNFFKK